MAAKVPPRVDEGVELHEAAEARRQASLRELKARWDRYLDCLNHPDAHQKIDAIFDARGRMKKRPKAGPSY